jgi:hypothetical protein
VARIGSNHSRELPAFSFWTCSTTDWPLGRSPQVQSKQWDRSLAARRKNRLSEFEPTRVGCRDWPSQPLFSLNFVPILNLVVKRIRSPLHYSSVGGPPNTWASCSDGTVPLSPACPTRAHLSWTWTGKGAPPPKGRTTLFWRLRVEIVCKPQ